MFSEVNRLDAVVAAAAAARPSGSTVSTWCSGGPIAHDMHQPVAAFAVARLLQRLYQLRETWALVRTAAGLLGFHRGKIACLQEYLESSLVSCVSKQFSRGCENQQES